MKTLSFDWMNRGSFLLQTLIARGVKLLRAC